MGYIEFIKHLRYKSMYKENELYWGLGIEEETYLQFTKPIHVAAPIIKKNHAPERYSVSYYNNYKPSYKEAFELLFSEKEGFFALPFFINAHAFNKVDIYGNHATTYTKNPKPNPKFSGKTFYQELCEFLPKYYLCRPVRFTNIYNKSCIFDGDTLEFITRDFYKANADNVLKELVRSKRDLLNAMNTFLIQRGVHTDKGQLMYPTENPGFVVHYTNPSNISMFNNGTYHINITLPTMLGSIKESGLPEILNYDEFKYKHKKFIRFIQWTEPFIVAVYGSPDPFSKVSGAYSKASQRCAVSRYIGLCTYDTNAMPVGKIMTLPIGKIRGSDTPFWWYKSFHATSGYKTLPELGMDISFQKHHNHGVEIRFLDWFPESMLKGLIEFYVHLADLSLNADIPEEPIMNEDYNNFLVDVLKHGKDYVMPYHIVHLYERILGFKFKTLKPTVRNIYEIINVKIRELNIPRICAKAML